MVGYDCPHCGAHLEAPESLTGKDQTCPVCRQRTIVPLPTVRVVSRPSSPYAAPPKVPGIISIPLLISAIGNCVAAVVWLSTCFGVIFTAVLVVLLVYEFMLYADLGNQMKIVAFSRVKTIAICEIVAGLFSTPALVCGIIILVNLNRVNINAGKMVAPLLPPGAPIPNTKASDALDRLSRGS